MNTTKRQYLSPIGNAKHHGLLWGFDGNALAHLLAGVVDAELLFDSWAGDPLFLIDDEPGPNRLSALCPENGDDNRSAGDIITLEYDDITLNVIASLCQSHRAHMDYFLEEAESSDTTFIMLAHIVTNRDLAEFVDRYSNSAIARACGVTETTVRQWLKTAKLTRTAEFNRHSGEISGAEIIALRKRSHRSEAHAAQRHNRRLTKERVSRIISQIGEAAGVVVQHPDPDANRRLKYASAHDIRRGCAQRLINAGVSAETLKVVLRHRDFDTTERFYGATRAAQSAASEINEKLAASRTKNGLVGGTEEGVQLSADELRKLKALPDSL